MDSKYDIKLSNNLKHEVLIHAVAWMNFENIMLNERGPLQKTTYWIMSFHMRCLEKANL